MTSCCHKLRTVLRGYDRSLFRSAIHGHRPVRIRRRGLRIVLATACLFLAPITTQGQVHETFESIGSALQDAARLAGNKAARNAEFAAARNAFFEAQRTGDNLEEARAALANLLHQKDLYFGYLVLGSGPYDAPLEMLDRLTGGLLDGGIPPAARREFNDWIIKIREELGARHAREMIVPRQEDIAPAVAAAEPEYRTYLAARDRAEFAARGLPAGLIADIPEPAVEPDRMDSIREENWQHQQRAFAAEQAFREWVVKLFAERYGGDEAGEYARYGFGGAFGNRFTDVLREIFESPKDAEGNLVDPSQFGLDSSIRDPHDAVLAVMMREHPAPYALEWLRDETPEDGSIAGAGYTWRALTARFGETAVVEGARIIDQADRVPAEEASTRVVDPRALGGWSDRPGQLLHELLVFGSGERFLTALLWHRRDAEIDPHNPRSLPAAQGSSEQLLKAAESVRSSLVEGAAPAGAALSDDAYRQFLAAIQGESGLHVVRQFERGEGSGFANLAMADAGTIFGTATQGGPANQGFIFSVNADGSDYRLIHGFQFTGTQRPGPNALMLGPDGALYGTLQDGGDHNRGALYRVETDGSDFTILHHFSDARDQDGGRPILIGSDASGTLYGTCNNGQRNAAPRLFRINVDGSGFEVIYRPLTTDERNRLTTERDNAAEQVESLQQALASDAPRNVPERVIQQWEERLPQMKARFEEAQAALAAAGDGMLGPMTVGEDGFFYGVAQAMVDRQQHSVIFRLSDDGRAYEVLHHFDGAPLDGTRAETPPLVASDGKLYGFTATGGIANAGVIYRLDRDGSNYEVIFNPEDRFSPGIRPIEGPGGMLYAIGMLRTGPSQPRLYRIARDGGDMTILDEFARDRSRPVQRMSPDVRYHGGALFGWNDNRLLRYRLPH
jgi:uncharacterized repeat protein (TIGR03803 family)